MRQAWGHAARYREPRAPACFGVHWALLAVILARMSVLSMNTMPGPLLLVNRNCKNLQFTR